MNVRIGADIKAAGDRVLSNAGYSPSRAARALWSFLARNEGDERAVSEMLGTLEGEDDAHRFRERQRRLAAFERGMRLFDDALEGLGVQVGDETANMSAKELMEIAYDDRLDEEEASWTRRA